jgi:hypothetical protein
MTRVGIVELVHALPVRTTVTLGKKSTVQRGREQWIPCIVDGSTVPSREDPETSRALQHMIANGGGASTLELRQWGVPRAAVERMIRRGQIVRQVRGRFRLPPPQSQDAWAARRSDHLMSAASVAGRDGVLALRTAALAWQLPVARFPDAVELIRPPGSRRPPGTRLVRRDLDADCLVEMRGLQVTNLERTSVDLALDLPTPEALVTLDAAIRRGADRRVMVKLLQQMGSARGSIRGRQAIAWADGHSESALESRGRGELMVRGAPRPLSNVTFRMGEVEFRIDHWWPDLAMGGEADGALKYSSDEGQPTDLWREKLRQEWFEDELGLPVLRYIDREVRFASQGLYARFVRKRARAAQQLWVPPSGLQIVQTPLPGVPHEDPTSR